MSANGLNIFTPRWDIDVWAGAEGTFPKMMVGAAYLRLPKSSLVLRWALVTFPKMALFGKVTAKNLCSVQQMATYDRFARSGPLRRGWVSLSHSQCQVCPPS